MRTLEEIASQSVKHMREKSVEQGDQIQTVMANTYSNPDQFELEMNQIFKKRPLPLTYSDKIPSAGSFHFKEFKGVPLIAVRSEKGQIQVFVNSCRHRGAQLKINCSKLVCPYHGWSYNAKGELILAPGEHGLVNRRTRNLRLKEIPAFEYGGVVWIILDSDLDEKEIEKHFYPLQSDSKNFGFVPKYSISGDEFSVKCNWKIGVEAFLEVYHFTHAHAPYLAELEFPNLSLADTFNENARTVVPIKESKDGDGILDWAQIMYFIFPSSFLLFYSDHMALISLTPVSVSETRFTYTAFVPNYEDKQNQEIIKKMEFLKIIIGQDVEILKSIQDGLKYNNKGRFIFTRLESLLGKFHKDIHSLCHKAQV